MTSHEKQQHWSQRFEQQAQSGLTITAFCKANQINIGTYYYWKQKLSDNASTLRLHPVVVQESRSRGSDTLTAFWTVGRTARRFTRSPYPKLG